MQKELYQTKPHSTTPLDKLEHSAADLVARLAPWLAPLPTAYLVGRATIDNLNWPVWVAIVAAAVIESLGLASTSTALALWDWNRSKRKTDPSAPVGLAFGLVGVYFLVATGLTVLLDVIPQAADVAPAIFPALSLTGVTILALRADHARRKMDVHGRAKARKDARAKVQRAKATTAVLNVEPSTVGAKVRVGRATGKANGQGRLSKAAVLDVLLDYLDGQPGASLAQAGRAIARSKSTVANYTGELIDTGRLVKNGQGWEVIDNAQGGA